MSYLQTTKFIPLRHLHCLTCPINILQNVPFLSIQATLLHLSTDTDETTIWEALKKQTILVARRISRYVQKLTFVESNLSGSVHDDSIHEVQPEVQQRRMNVEQSYPCQPVAQTVFESRRVESVLHLELFPSTDSVLKLLTPGRNGGMYGGQDTMHQCHYPL